MGWKEPIINKMSGMLYKELGYPAYQSNHYPSDSLTNAYKPIPPIKAEPLTINFNSCTINLGVRNEQANDERTQRPTE